MTTNSSISGVLLVDKPTGMTSHDVVARIRKLLHATPYALRPRVGHTGTLDPFATGLLIIAIGSATKNIKYSHDWPKEYEATVTLGATSTTDDPKGKITPTSPPPPLLHKERGDSNVVRKILDSFIGEQQQVPPAFSAKKIGGERAYKIARRNRRGDPTSPSGLRGAGRIIMPPHVITIHDLELLMYQYPELTIRVRCSTGTYIRALARDIGQKLKVGAYCSTLRRTAIGPHAVNQATSPTSLFELRGASLTDLLLPPDALIP